MIQRRKQQSTEIQSTVFKSLKYSAFALLPEKYHNINDTFR